MENKEVAESSQNPEEDLLLRLTMPGQSLRPQTIEAAKQQAQSAEQPVVEEATELNREIEDQTLTEAAEPVEEETMSTLTMEETQEQKVEQVQEPVVEESNEQADLLRRVAMPQQAVEEVAPVKEHQEDSPEDPYIYREGHPHIGNNFDMQHIENLTKNMFFSGDIAADRLKKKN